jgi:hypothetical protein
VSDSDKQEEIEKEINLQIRNIYNNGFIDGGESAFDAIKKVFTQIRSDKNQFSFNFNEIIDLIDLSRETYKKMMNMRNELEAHVQDEDSSIED